MVAWVVAWSGLTAKGDDGIFDRNVLYCDRDMMTQAVGYIRLAKFNDVYT